MAFRVEIAPRAFRDLDEILEYIKQRNSFEAALRWFNGIVHAIRALREMPERCAAAEESEELGLEVRVLLYGKRNRQYKVYFDIGYETANAGIVHVFHVRHWARRGAEADELQELMQELDEGE